MIMRWLPLMIQWKCETMVAERKNIEANHLGRLWEAAHFKWAMNGKRHFVNTEGCVVNICESDI